MLVAVMLPSYVGMSTWLAYLTYDGISMMAV